MQFYYTIGRQKWLNGPLLERILAEAGSALFSRFGVGWGRMIWVVGPIISDDTGTATRLRRSDDAELLQTVDESRRAGVADTHLPL